MKVIDTLTSNIYYFVLNTYVSMDFTFLNFYIFVEAIWI